MKLDDDKPQFRMVAVIDVGSSAIRMEIAQIDPNDKVRHLENLRHGTNLGRDVFKNGHISNETTEQCVDILRSYRKILNEYRVGVDELWAIGTSAVREAENRDTFLDRVFMGSGIEVEALDVPDSNRLTYNAVQKFIKKQPKLAENDVIVVEIGGGITDILYIKNCHVVYSNSFSFGLLRLKSNYSSITNYSKHLETVISQHISHIKKSFMHHGLNPKKPLVLAMSAHARTLAEHLLAESSESELYEIKIKDVLKAVKKFYDSNVENNSRLFNVSYELAEALPPAMTGYCKIAEVFGSNRIFVPSASFRDGMIIEFAASRKISDDFKEQALYSAFSIGKKFMFDKKHSLCVTDLSMKIFRTLKSEYQLDEKQEILLNIAAVLHDIGHFINSSSHHKHSYYLIMNSDIFGLKEADKNLVGLIARYHRKAVPSKRHSEYTQLKRDERITILKLASILRVADALDRNHFQQIKDPEIVLTEHEMQIVCSHLNNLAVERMALAFKSRLFEEVYGLNVNLIKA